MRISLLAGATLLMLAACSKEPKEMTIKIGHVGPISGPIGHLGKDNENGARMAIDVLNAKNLRIGGKK